MKQTRQKPKLFLIALIVVIAILSIHFVFQQEPQRSFTFNGTNYRFTKVALNLSQQEQGLMNSTVNSSTFELFQFNRSSIYPFWMKDTMYPLDIIWINDITVVYIANAIPCSSYSPNQKSCIIYNSFDKGYVANNVIEAQSGFVNRTGMHIGSQVYIH